MLAVYRTGALVLALALIQPAQAASAPNVSPSPAISALILASAQARAPRKRILKPLPPNPCRKTVCPR